MRGAPKAGEGLGSGGRRGRAMRRPVRQGRGWLITGWPRPGLGIGNGPALAAAGPVATMAAEAGAWAVAARNAHRPGQLPTGDGQRQSGLGPQDRDLLEFVEVGRAGADRRGTGAIGTNQAES